MVNAEQPKEKKIPPVRASQPMLRMSERERSNILPRRMGGPSGSGNGDPGRNGVPMAMVVVYIEEGREKEMETPQMKGNLQEERNPQGGGGDPNGKGGPGGNGDPPDRRGGEPPRENGNPGGGDVRQSVLTILGHASLNHIHWLALCIYMLARYVI